MRSVAKLFLTVTIGFVLLLVLVNLTPLGNAIQSAYLPPLPTPPAETQEKIDEVSDMVSGGGSGGGGGGSGNGGNGDEEMEIIETVTCHNDPDIESCVDDFEEMTDVNVLTVSEVIEQMPFLRTSFQELSILGEFEVKQFYEYRFCTDNPTVVFDGEEIELFKSPSLTTEYTLDRNFDRYRIIDIENPEDKLAILAYDPITGNQLDFINLNTGDKIIITGYIIEDTYDDGDICEPQIKYESALIFFAHDSTGFEIQPMSWIKFR